MRIPGKRVTILGLGKSGFQSALCLKERGFEVFVSESGKSPDLEARLQNLRSLQIEGEVGGHSLDKVLSADWVLISPGIPPSAVIYQEVLKRQIPILSDIEVASWFCESRKIIAVTGTAGKTTVTTLITRVLNELSGKAISSGNIGNPWIGELGAISKDDFVVLELSSFQLMHCPTLRPHVGVLLNLSANHLDWHKDLEEYVQSKLNIFRNQTAGDFSLYRAMDRETYFPGFQFSSKEILFGYEKNLNPNEEVVRKVAAIFDCPRPKVDEILRNFEGVEHRLEKVGFYHGVSFINDSKCTTTASLAWALDKFEDQSVVLIAGGHPKSDDFYLIQELIKRKVCAAFLIGEAKEILAKAWNGYTKTFFADSFRQGVESAGKFASSGQTVLLSPACASFDMFRNYMERGNLFKQIVYEMEGISQAAVNQ